jgi:Uma2 family endonuclease
MSVPYRRITVEEYEAMLRAGIFTEADKLDLVEGVLVRKMTKGRKHSTGTIKARRSIERALPAGRHVGAETPVRLPTRDTLHEPDLSVVRGEPDDYADLDPGPRDVALVVEVADSSLEADRAMAFTYLGAGIPTYWLVNVHDRRLEVYTTDPDSPTIVPESGAVDLVLDGVAVARIAVADLLPRA